MNSAGEGARLCSHEVVYGGEVIRVNHAELAEGVEDLAIVGEKSFSFVEESPALGESISRNFRFIYLQIELRLHLAKLSKIE